MFLRPFLAALIGLVLALGVPSTVRAQTVGTPASDTTFLALGNGQFFVGQVVSVPAANLQLQSFTLNMGRATCCFLTVQPLVYEVSSISGGNVSVVATPVWSGTNQDVPMIGSNPFTFAPGVSVDPTKQYVIGVSRTNVGEGGQSRVYTAATSDYAPGESVIGASIPTSMVAGDLGFTAVFSAAPVTVPTLTEWAMIMLGLALAGMGAILLARRSSVAFHQSGTHG